MGQDSGFETAIYGNYGRPLISQPSMGTNGIKRRPVRPGFIIAGAHTGQMTTIMVASEEGS